MQQCGITPRGQRRQGGVLRIATTTANLAGSALILLLMMLVGLDVAGRNLFNSPISGVPEMVTLSIVVIVFLQAPAALAAGRLTRSDALINTLSDKLPLIGRLVETLFDLLGMFVFAVIAYGTWPLLGKAWARHEFLGAVGDFTAPVWPVKAAVLIGSSLLVLQFTARIWARWRKPHAPV